MQTFVNLHCFFHFDSTHTHTRMQSFKPLFEENRLILFTIILWWQTKNARPSPAAVRWRATTILHTNRAFQIYFAPQTFTNQSVVSALWAQKSGKIGPIPYSGFTIKHLIYKPKPTKFKKDKFCKKLHTTVRLRTIQGLVNSAAGQLQFSQ